MSPCTTVFSKAPKHKCSSVEVQQHVGDFGTIIGKGVRLVMEVQEILGKEQPKFTGVRTIKLVWFPVWAWTEGFLELLRLFTSLPKTWVRSGSMLYGVLGQGLGWSSQGQTTTRVSLSLVLGPRASSADSTIDGPSSQLEFLVGHGSITVWGCVFKYTIKY